jgi:outer membrane protein OmpA-like peptidoglycan-associated protein
MKQTPFRSRVQAVFIAMATLFAATAQAQVSVMNRVPSQQELREALSSAKSQVAPAPAGATSERTRAVEGIMWDKPAAGALPAGPTGAETPQPQAVMTTSAAAAAKPVGPAVAMPIQFDINSARVNPVSMGYVDAIAQLLASEPALRLTVEGHTDASGDPKRNLLLSWDRALSIYKTLVERHGVDPVRLQPVGRGSAEPLDGMLPQAPANRRVQFRVVG